MVSLKGESSEESAGSSSSITTLGVGFSKVLPDLNWMSDIGTGEIM